MFVTSDIYDLAEVARSRREEWAEQLVGAVALHGSVWPGEEAALRVLQRAVELCRSGDDISYANYRLFGQSSFKTVRPASLTKLVEKHGDRIAGIDLRGARITAGARDAAVGVSASVSSPLDRGMLCVVVAPDLVGEEAGSFLSQAGELLGADYGYAFLRDDAAGPENYALGMGFPLDYSELEQAELAESDTWAKVLLSEAWAAKRFPLRDIFEANLLTTWQLDRDLGNGQTLRSWIAAAQERGILEVAGDYQWIWYLNETEMYSIRTDLMRMGVILSSLPRVYRGLGQSPGITLSAAAHSALRH